MIVWPVVAAILALILLFSSTGASSPVAKIEPQSAKGTVRNVYYEYRSLDGPVREFTFKLTAERG